MAIITYGKCFASAEGRRIKLDKSALKEFSADELRIHDELIVIRNTYIAHGGISKFEKNPVVVTRVKHSEGYFGYMVHDSAVYMSALRLNLALINVFLSKIISFVDDKVNAAYDKLMKHVVNELPEEEFENNMFYPEPDKLVALHDIDQQNLPEQE